MNYEEMSNGELSWILWHLHKKIPEGHATICVHDYCTDWNATMPLAVECGVFYDKHHDGLYVATLVYEFGKKSLSYEFHSYDKNPLRAIVICLIKVLTAKRIDFDMGNDESTVLTSVVKEGDGLIITKINKGGER